MENRVTSWQTYKAFGLGIQSALPLPELLSADVEVDVVVRFGSVELPPLSTTDNGVGFHITSSHAYLYWTDSAKFLIREGREVIIEPLEFDETLLQLYLLGQVFAVLLHQRGLMVLHASAVAIDGVVALFIANKGYGKSTTAAALCAKGHSLVSDDVAAIDMSTALPFIFPAYPSFKLWPDALKSIGRNPDKLPPLYPGFEKRVLHLKTDFSLSPLPVGAIFVLAGGSTFMFEDLSPHEAIIELMRYLYVARFGNSVFRNSISHFLQTAQLARIVPTYKITRTNDLSILPDIVQQIEAHLHKIPKKQSYQT